MATTLKGTIWGGGLTISASPATATVPTGSVDIRLDQTTFFTVPAGIIILCAELPPNSSPANIRYVGVTPKSNHTFQLIGGYNNATFPPYFYQLICNTHNDMRYGIIKFPGEVNNIFARISWSPKINTHTPDFTDY